MSPRGTRASDTTKVPGFGREVYDSWFSPPRGSRAAAGVAVFVCVALLGVVLLINQYVYQLSENVVLMSVSLALALSGILFSALAYHAATRAAFAIRTSIPDFPTFLGVLKRVVMEELNANQERLVNPSGQNVDLLLMLTFPFYSLTKDLDPIGHEVNQVLGGLREDSKTSVRLITASNPINLMLAYDRQYHESKKLYDTKVLREAARRLNGKNPKDWHHEDIEDHVVAECVRVLSHLLRMTKYETCHQVKLLDDQFLQEGFLQAIWSNRSAAIIFMEPVSGDPRQPTSEEEVEGEYKPEDSVGQTVQLPTVPCYGFATEDHHMRAIIKRIIEIKGGLS